MNARVMASLNLAQLAPDLWQHALASLSLDVHRGEPVTITVPAGAVVPPALDYLSRSGAVVTFVSWDLPTARAWAASFDEGTRRWVA